MRIEAKDVRELNLLKHYRIIRKWACKNYDLNDADLELLIYFDCMDLFTREDFKIGMLGKEDIPTSLHRNKIMKGKTYMDKVMITSIEHVNKDKNR